MQESTRVSPHAYICSCKNHAVITKMSNLLDVTRAHKTVVLVTLSSCAVSFFRLSIPLVSVSCAAVVKCADDYTSCKLIYGVAKYI